MGKGHKERRREQRARENEEREKEVRVLKDELQEDEQKKFEALQTTKQSKQEKNTETSSDTDSGHGSSSTIASTTDSLQSSQTIEQTKRRTLIKGLHNIGNTCFFNVVIQSLAHTPLLTTTLYQNKSNLAENNGTNYYSTTTAQLMKIFNEFTSNERKKSSIDPKPLFNSLIQKNPAYKGYDQHDCHELFMNLMLILRAEEAQLRKLPTRSTEHSDDQNDPSKMFCLIGCNEPYTSYDSIFGGHLLDVLTCKKCTKSLMKIEPFIGILLPLTDRMSPSENYRQRRKRDDYTGNKGKKEPKILSRKQQKALKKQERKSTRKSVTSANGKLKGRQAAKKKLVEEEQLPAEEESSSCSLPPTEEPVSIESTDPKPDETEKPAEENNEAETEEKETQPEEEEEEEEQQQESENEDEPEGPLTSTESTCVLADMVSKLTLIHETSSRPLPFVDQRLAEQFLTSASSKSTTTDETIEIKTLEQCFQRYFKVETLSGENSFDCYYCRSLEQGQKRVLTEATRQTVFFQLPPVLPVFLKRFQMHGSHSEKIQKFIEFPLQLDLNHRCSSKVESNSSIYSLYAVIEHSGTLRSGHYVAYIKHSMTDDDLSENSYSKPIDELLKDFFQKIGKDSRSDSPKKSEINDPSLPPSSWYHISDNTIHKVPEHKVLEADAYVLFYRRMQNED